MSSLPPQIARQLTALSAFRRALKEQFPDGLPAGIIMPSKMGNKFVVIDGIKFRSRKEAGYYCRLKLRVKAGLVTRFERQVRLPVFVNGIKILTYFCDFVEYLSDGSVHYVDVKGFRTDVYKIKKRAVEAYYSIKIIEA